MKPFHQMTKREAVERLRALYNAQPKADWDTLAVGNVILHKGCGWRIVHIPPKRRFHHGDERDDGRSQRSCCGHGMPRPTSS